LAQRLVEEALAVARWREIGLATINFPRRQTGAARFQKEIFGSMQISENFEFDFP
jgi:hypothetical protein